MKATATDIETDCSNEKKNERTRGRQQRALSSSLKRNPLKTLKFEHRKNFILIIFPLSKVRILAYNTVT